MSNENEAPIVGELISAEASVNQALAVITKAEIDQQIVTAHAYPRSLAKFQKRALEMVTLDEETAESCIFSRPVGKKKDEATGKYVQQFAEGMSIRMAEIVGACYGNLRAGAMCLEMTPRYVKTRGRAHDLETNFASESEVIESTVDKNGNPFSERMRVVVAKAALSKARRDAIFSVVPRALCKKLEDAARKTAIGDASTLEKRRAAVMRWIGTVGIDPARVFASLGIKGEADIGLEQLALLTGLKTAIKDGDSTLDEAFPPVEGETRGAAASAAATAAARAAQKAQSNKPADKPAEKPADKPAEEKPAAPATQKQETDNGKF